MSSHSRSPDTPHAAKPLPLGIRPESHMTLRAKASSPYLAHPWRLSDVIAALQVLGSYHWASREPADWARTLGQPRSAHTWDEIFKDHPEFFRVNEAKQKVWASVRWRHTHPQIYAAAEHRELSRAEYLALSEAERENLSRSPLATEQIESLIRTAIELHNRGIAQQVESRWLWTPAFALLGVVLGAVLSAVLSS
jgi:hypothetical protein